MELTLDQLLKTVTAHNASDLHLIVDSEPMIRIDGRLTPLDLPKLNRNQIQGLGYSIITESQKKKLEEFKELDFAIDVPNIGRFRGNYYFERHNLAAAFRIIPQEMPTLEQFKMPKILGELMHREKGLVLVTGPTGSGKSTTMAAMVNEINRTQDKHIITIEDPVEFLHPHNKSVVSHRSVGEDTESFATALKYALRQDPDVIYVGEMRDVETIRAAIMAAETGHLVLGTLHTNSAPQTINRIVNVFPADEQALIRTQLSMSLLAVVAQVLVPRTAGGRKAIQEILVTTPAIANLIRDDKIHQIHASMQLGQQVSQMQLQSQELIRAAKAGDIKPDDALRYAANPEEIKKALGLGDRF
jgi:twitching motility protein PilT